MGFRIVSGTMGGGKSYYAAQIALEAWAQGAVVHSNMDFRWDVLEKLGYLEKHVTLPDDPKEWIGCLKGGAEGAENVLIVDESAMIFHTWDLAASKKNDRQLFDVLVMSRKIGMDCYFISQSAANVNSALRRIAIEEVRCVAVARIGGIGPLLRPIVGDFMRVRLNPTTGKVLTREYDRYNKDVGACYSTEAVRGAASQVQREVTRTESTKPKLPTFFKGVLAAMAASLLYGGYSVIQYMDKPAPVAAAGPPAAPAPAGIADRIKDALSPAHRAPPPPGAAPQTQYPPALHPATVSGHKMKWIEWDEADERILLSVYRSGPKVRLYTLGGQVFAPGAHIEGEEIASIQAHNGAWFCTTRTERVFYVRPLTYKERREYDEYFVRLAHERKQTQWTQTPFTMPASQPLP